MEQFKTADSLARLHAIAARAIPAEEIRQAGYLSVAGSSDLFRVGYFVRHWYRFSDHSEILEYNPRNSNLPRLTAITYAEQAEIHLALGLNLVGPGEPWGDYHGPGLFDKIYFEKVF